MLSVSDFESFHLAPLEGAAARTDVLMLGWTGASDIHKDDWIRDSVLELSKKHVSHTRKGQLYERGEENRQFVMGKIRTSERFPCLSGMLLPWLGARARKTSVPFIQTSNRSNLLPENISGIQTNVD